MAYPSALHLIREIAAAMYRIIAGGRAELAEPIGGGAVSLLRLTDAIRSDVQSTSSDLRGSLQGTDRPRPPKWTPAAWRSRAVSRPDWPRVLPVADVPQTEAAALADSLRVFADRLDALAAVAWETALTSPTPLQLTACVAALDEAVSRMRHQIPDRERQN